MVTVVGVQFQRNGKIYQYEIGNLEVKQNDYVIADTSHGIDLGQIVVGGREMNEGELSGPQKKIIRIATEKDLKTSAENREKEKEAFSICQKKITEHKLDMKLVSVENAFDNSKALFYFTANGRVDFRSLVKDLASVFKMRIELRQIGVRDEARMIGGLGPCGRQICCGSFLDEFQPVSIKMAKEQNLSLNPTKISGVCGRLMCCLKYEQDHYEQTRKVMPKLGKEVITPDGNGIVSDLNIVKETVFVRITNGDSSEIKEYPLESIQRVSGPVQGQITDKNDPSGSNEMQISEPETKKKPEVSEKRKNRQEPEMPNENRNDEDTRNNMYKKQKGQRKQDKTESKRQNSPLGKPVMRENPNRNSSAQNPDHEENKKTVSNWAEAVQKAMDSIN